MTQGFTDWSQLGIFPLQDHEYGVPEGIRQQLVGGRLVKMTDPGDDSDPESSMVEYGADHGLGTLGDIHPWFFWQTADRGERAMGSWAQAFAGMTWDGCTGGFKPGQTGHAVSPSQVLPFNRGGTSPGVTEAYRRKYPGWPMDIFPNIPQGTMVVVMPGTSHSAQHELMLHADPRLVAVNCEAGGPANAGTIVMDLQPEGELCVNATRDAGRDARLQSMMRVICMPTGLEGDIATLSLGQGNSLAWQLGKSGIDELAGYGLCFAEIDGGGPITGGPGQKGPLTGKGAGRGGSFGKDFRGGPEGGGDPGNVGGNAGGGHGQEGGGFIPDGNGGLRGLTGGGGSSGGGSGHGQYTHYGSPDNFGRWEPAPKASHGCAFMAHATTFGPFHAGSETDKHRHGKDADGHVMNSGHIATGAYFYNDSEYDGPLLFERQRYPHDVKSLKLKGKVHLCWDKDLPHKWAGGSKEGHWRWYAEVPYYAPPGKKGGGKKPPGGGPTTGGPGVPGPNPPGGGPGPGKGPITGGPPKQGAPGGGPTTGGPAPAPGTGAPGGPNTGRQNSGSGPKTGSRGAPRGGGPYSWDLLPEDPKKKGGPITPGPPAPLPRVPINIPPPPGGDNGTMPPGQWYGPGSVPPGWEDEEDPPWSMPGSGQGGYWGQSNGKSLGGGPGEALIRESVGDTSKVDESLFVIHHPTMESFAEMAFRPQFMVNGYPSFTHNPDAEFETVRDDESVRPQVLAVRSWGGQDNASAEWTYVQQPDVSRARGGTAHGGILFTPPHLELEDYFGIGSQTNVHTLSTVSYVTVAPGVGFALGTPGTDGGLNSGSIIIAQDPVDTDDHGLVLKQINSAGNQIELFSGVISQSSGEVVCRGAVQNVTGDINQSGQAFVIPRGDTSDRQSTIALVGGELRINTDVTGSVDSPEFYDKQTTSWKQLATTTLVVGDDSKLDLDGSSAMTGGLTIVGTAPQMVTSDVAAGTNGNKKSFKVMPAYTSTGGSAEENFGLVIGKVTSSVSKLSLGGGESAVNAATAVGVYCAADNTTTSGTEIARFKLTGARVGGTGNPDAAAILECTSTTQGLLVPRMTTVQKSAISSPPAGLVVFDTGTGKLECFDGSNWQAAW